MKTLTSDVLVIGSGPAGMMAAITAAERGARVTVLDPNPKTGKKLRITGKGRCNITNDSDPRAFLENICTNGKFFKSALYAFPPQAVMDFFTDAGVPLKTERGGRVFPMSDNANDVADALFHRAERLGVEFVHERARELMTGNGRLVGLRTDKAVRYSFAAVLCTGGLSYPGTGSTGDGYALARSVGHRIVEPRPSLVPWEGEAVCASLQGLSLRNVTVSLYEKDRLLFREQGIEDLPVEHKVEEEKQEGDPAENQAEPGKKKEAQSAKTIKEGRKIKVAEEGRGMNREGFRKDVTAAAVSAQDLRHNLCFAHA